MQDNQDQGTFNTATDTPRSTVAWTQADARDSDGNGTDDSISWTASEFIAHHKSMSWYTNLAFVVIVASAVAFLLTRDKITVITIIVAGIALGVYANRQPRELTYQFDVEGFTIGQRRFAYASFRSFSIDDDAAFASIILLPLRRFSPAITLYYAPENEEQIADLIARHLPYEEYRHDPIDKLMKRIRF